MAIQNHSLQIHAIGSRPASHPPAKSARTDTFRSFLNGIASDPSSQTIAKTPGDTSASSSNTAPGGSNPATPTTTNLPSSPFPMPTNEPPPPPPVSSSGTSLANLMAAASYAGVPYGDLTTMYNGTSSGVFDPAWQTKLANAIEARLESVAGTGSGNRVYDPNPANDAAPIDLTNTKQFTSSSSEINSLLNTMWAAVHAGDVNAYHTALTNVDSWYQSNGQQNYYTGLTDNQVAAFNPANNISPAVSMPNANAAVAAAELSAIRGQSASISNLAAIAQSAAALKT